MHLNYKPLSVLENSKTEVTSLNHFLKNPIYSWKRIIVENIATSSTNLKFFWPLQTI